MPFLTPGDSTVHHHSLLAGVSAATAAVVGCFLLVLGVWHRVSGTVGTAVTVIVWTLAALVLAGAVYAAVFLGLRLRHHLAHPETLTRHAVRAEVIPAAVRELPAAEMPAIEAPRPEIHYHFDSQEAVEAALQAMQDRQAREGLN